MSERAVIHIGLHKTGTRFLQRMVFRQLDSRTHLVNPQPLHQAVRLAVRESHRPELAEAARKAVAEWRASRDPRMLVLSEPHISGDMYSSHEDYAQNLALVRELFPSASIVIFIRNQADWLQSAYRQNLVRGRSVPIHFFLNFYDGGFHPRLARWVRGSRNVEALKLRFLEIYQAYAAAYGEENVYLFRQEDLRNRGDLVKQRLAGILDLEALPAPPAERSQNRSYSALAIRWFHPGTNRRLPKPAMEEICEPVHRFPKLRGRARKLRRTLIQHGFDKLIYRDWDLLAEDGMRRIIDDHYAEENRELKRIADAVLEPEREDGRASTNRKRRASERG